MGRYSGKTCRLLSMLFLTGSFFLVEIVVGYVTNSIALVADSFHMLSDVVALIVGFASIRIARWPSRINTYGWVRSEILGALFNAVFLLALCFSILVESLKRLVKTEPIEQPVLLLAVGSAGLFVNLIGLLLFHGHAHGHSHGGGGKEKGSLGSLDSRDENQALFSENGDVVGGPGIITGEDGDPGKNATVVIQMAHGHSHAKQGGKSSSSAQLNMKGVFLHVLGDALGSVIVIISSLIIWFAEGDWRFYVDPAMSIAMVLIILSTTIPLLKETSLILLQTAPSSVDQDILKGELEKFDGVLGVHEFHLWQLTSNRLVLSAHITCHNLREYMVIAARVKEFFHRAGIHSTTIQPEFVDVSLTDITTMDMTCNLKCSTTDCLKDTCCGNTPRSRSKATKTTGTPQASADVSEVSASLPATSGSAPQVNEGQNVVVTADGAVLTATTLAATKGSSSTDPNETNL